ncbi:putative methyltransferase NSUN6-like protein [Polychytrium aggregatum]|uniref:putative methyltransferase NSUN6-like protein n=1 Tax=Polychytrium aggregatum TaxID=110093 RepID=UPI0022FDB8D6|nr:putative methyltransferase NSUN6-like protein [Polychytrium aggregatum]KAI9207085.1 putative methyltransferase NSUN6-like protein [Polychytrium aggregatum]
MDLSPVEFPRDAEALLRSHMSPGEWSRICEALAVPPRTTFLRVNTLIWSRSEALQATQAYVDEQCAAKGWPSFTVQCHPQAPDVLYVNGVGPLTAQPVEKEVIVDVLCGNAVLRGADVFAVGVLAAESPMKRGDRVAVYVDLDGACLRGQKERYHGRKVFIGNGIALQGREDIYIYTPKELAGRGVGIQMTEPLYRSPSFSSMIHEGVFLQNLPSILVGHVLDPKPGELILDMCAAPGGKTTHIANLTNNQSTIIALDRSRPKIERLREHLDSQGYTSIKAFSCDATSCVMSQEETAAWESSPEWPSSIKLRRLPRQRFDRIICDAPCSALGQRPAFNATITVPVLSHHPQYQRQILHAAHALLKEGGMLVYSTCTFYAEENECNVAFILETFPDMELVDIPIQFRLGQRGLPVPGLREEHLAKCWRFNPGSPCGVGIAGEELESIGFFFALFRKRLQP